MRFSIKIVYGGDIAMIEVGIIDALSHYQTSSDITLIFLHNSANLL